MKINILILVAAISAISMSSVPVRASEVVLDEEVVENYSPRPRETRKQRAARSENPIARTGEFVGDTVRNTGEFIGDLFGANR
jgi:hypothetical protein